MQLLDTKVSYFRRCNQSDTPDGTTTLRKFLTASKAKEQILRVRTEADKDRRNQLKKQLPAATVSCVCSKRNTNHVVQHSGVVAFDIDLQDNTHIANYGELREQLAKIVHVAYCGLSVSGHGYWGIIPIRYPEQHEQHFRALEEDFRRIGINIDPAPKSVVSLRIVSYDPEGYINENAVPYEQLYTPKKPKGIQRAVEPGNSDIAPLLDCIATNGIDLTSTYDHWLTCGLALATEYGEEGRDYFHTVSGHHPEYNPAKTDKMYGSLLKSNRGAVTLGSFIHLCKQHGVSVSESRTPNHAADDPLANIQLPPGHKLETITVFGRKVTNQINEHGYPAFWDN